MLSANLSWKNPNEAETVGQRREKKSRQRGGSRSSGSGSSTASTSQRPQTRDTTHSWSIRRKTPAAASSSADRYPPKASVLPQLGADALGFLFPPRQDGDSLYEIDSTTGSTDEPRDSNTFPSAEGTLSPSSRPTSVCSTEIHSEVIFNEVQQLGPDSKISRVTTVTITTSDNNSEREDSSRERSSGEGSRPQLQLPRRVRSSRSLGSPKFSFRKPKSIKPPSPEPKSFSNADANFNASDAAPAAQQNKTSGKLLELKKDAQQLNSALHPPSNWKPPADWQARDSPTAEIPDTGGYPWGLNPKSPGHSGKPATPSLYGELDDIPASPLYLSGHNQTQTSLATPLQIRPTSSDQQTPPESKNPSITTFTRNLRRMEIATPAILSQHVTEAWDNIIDTTAAAAVTDGDGLAHIREEFEFEKRLWVLTSLGRLRFRDRLTGGAGEAGMVDKSILNLYALEADSWFLATKNHRSTVHSYSHNTSTSSAPHPWGRAPPNCRPLTTPLISTTAPYSPSSFDLIISRSLPVILRSTEYPLFLRDCNRMLKSGGHLVISFVDPSPKNPGPLMARWTEGLKLKLEMQFRCTRPSELLPHWLREVGGWAGAVEIETMDWVAVEKSDGGDQWDALRSVTGRAMYRKSYEGFIEPGGGGARGVWWWEDPLIVEECRSLGTTFQFYKYLHLKE